MCRLAVFRPFVPTALRDGGGGPFGLHRGRRGRKDGFTLVELAVVVTIIGVLASFAVPRYGVAVEQARLELAAARLRCVAVAQRMYKADTGGYAPRFDPLVRRGLLARDILDDSGAYVLKMDRAGRSSFLVVAARKRGTVWKGGLALDERGVLRGWVTDGERKLGPSS